MHSKDHTTGPHWRVLQCLSDSPCHADEIQKQCGGFRNMIDVLADLVEAGYTVKGADHRYVLTAEGREFMEEHTAQRADQRHA